MNYQSEESPASHDNPWFHLSLPLSPPLWLPCHVTIVIILWRLCCVAAVALNVVAHSLSHIHSRETANDCVCTLIPHQFHDDHKAY